MAVEETSRPTMDEGVSPFTNPVIVVVKAGRVFPYTLDLLFAVIVKDLVSTVKESEALKLFVKSGVPAYSAMRECVPAERVLRENVATPEPLRAAVPNTVEPFFKVTVPVATPRLATTVVVRVMLVP